MDTLILRIEQDEIAVASAEIAEIEVRLGTDLERPTDFDRCIELAHRVRNLLQVEGLREEMEMMLAARGSESEERSRQARRCRF